MSGSGSAPPGIGRDGGHSTFQFQSAHVAQTHRANGQNWTGTAAAGVAHEHTHESGSQNGDCVASMVDQYLQHTRSLGQSLASASYNKGGFPFFLQNSNQIKRQHLLGDESYNAAIMQLLASTEAEKSSLQSRITRLSNDISTKNDEISSLRQQVEMASLSEDRQAQAHMSVIKNLIEGNGNNMTELNKELAVARGEAARKDIQIYRLTCMCQQLQMRQIPCDVESTCAHGPVANHASGDDDGGQDDSGALCSALCSLGEDLNWSPYFISSGPTGAKTIPADYVLSLFSKEDLDDLVECTKTGVTVLSSLSQHSIPGDHTSEDRKQTKKSKKEKEKKATCTTIIGPSTFETFVAMPDKSRWDDINPDSKLLLLDEYPDIFIRSMPWDASKRKRIEEASTALIEKVTAGESKFSSYAILHTVCDGGPTFYHGDSTDVQGILNLGDKPIPATIIKQESLGCDSVDDLFNDLYSKQIPVGSNLWKHLSTDRAVIEELSSFCNDTSCPPGECHANVFATACDNYLIWPYFHILCLSCTMILTCSCLVFIIHSSDACCSFRLS